MNSAPALDDYLLELLGDAGAAVAPARPAPVAVVPPAVESDEAVAVAAAVSDIQVVGADAETIVADPAMVASIIEEMEKEFAPRPEPPAAPEPAEPAEDFPPAALAAAPAVDAIADVHVRANVETTVADPAMVASIIEEMEREFAAHPGPAPAPEPTRPAVDIRPAAPVAPPRAAPAAPIPLPVSAPRLPLSGSPAMTLLSPVAPAKAMPPLPDKPFLQAPIDSGARRRAAERTTRWLRMRCDEQHYALELLKVQEVVLPGTLLPLRGAASHMLGVMNLRGQVVPVIDLGLYLGRRAVESDATTRVVVLEEQGEILGLRVSAVEDVTNLTDQQIEPPDNARVGRITNHLFRGVARLNERAVILLDASQLLK